MEDAGELFSTCMVRRLLITGNDGIRRWGHWVDTDDDDGLQSRNMPAGTMRSSLAGQFIASSGSAYPTFLSGERKAPPSSGRAAPPSRGEPPTVVDELRWPSSRPATSAPLPRRDMTRLNCAEVGVTHHKWGDASPFKARPMSRDVSAGYGATASADGIHFKRAFYASPEPTRTPLRPQTSRVTEVTKPAIGSRVTTRGEYQLTSASIPACSRVQIELSSRGRYAGRLSMHNSSLTRVTGY